MMFTTVAEEERERRKKEGLDIWERGEGKAGK